MTNNVLQSPTKVVVRILGDMNGDGKVGIYETIMFANYFGLKKGEAGWNPDADMNGDDVTNIFRARHNNNRRTLWNKLFAIPFLLSAHKTGRMNRALFYN
jgi:hypothetical protein